MSDIQKKVDAFFNQYAAANTAGDFDAISRLYYKTFMFGLPQGSRTIEATDFAKLASKRREEFRAKGLSATRLKRTEAASISENYIRAMAEFDMQVGELTKRTRTTYIIFDDGERLQIVLQIDHQNLAEELVKRNGDQ